MDDSDGAAHANMGRLEERVRSFPGVAGVMLAWAVESGAGPVVTLMASQEELAGRLVHEFGDGLRVRLGFKFYTKMGGALCGATDLALPPAAIGSMPVRARTVLSVRDLRAGEYTMGYVEIASSDPTGAISVEFDSPWTGGVRRCGASDVAGWFAMPVAGARRFATLTGGRPTHVPVWVGTESCIDDGRYVVRPGQYEVLVPVGMRVGSQDLELLTIGPEIKVS